MATLEQIGAALKAADAAGDTEGARRLAAAYRAMQGSAPTAAMEVGSAQDDAQRQARGVPTEAQYAQQSNQLAKEDVLADTNPIAVQGGALVNSLRNTGMGLMQANAEGTNAMVDNPVTRGVAGAIGLGNEQKALAGVTQARADQLRAQQGQNSREEAILARNPTFSRSDTTFDVAQAVLPGMSAAKTTQGFSLLGRLGTDVAVGAAQGGTQALGEGDSRATEAGISGAAGGIGTALGAGVGRVATGLSDKVTGAAREVYEAAVKRGLQPNISGLLDSGPLKTTTEFLQSLPLAGGAKAVKREVGELVQAASKNLGLNTTELSDAAMAEAKSNISKQYSGSLGNHVLDIGEAALRDMAGVVNNATTDLTDEMAKVVGKNFDKIQNEIIKSGGKMTGAQYQNLRAELAKTVKRLGDSGAADVVSDLRHVLDRAAESSLDALNNGAGEGLRKANRMYADYRLLKDRVLPTLGNRPGTFTAAQLASQTKPSPTGAIRSTTSMRDLGNAAERTGVGAGARELPLWKKLTAGGAAAATGIASLPTAATLSGLGIAGGRILNSRLGSRYLAEGLSPSARRIAEQLGLVARSAPAATTRAKRRKELQK